MADGDHHLLVRNHVLNAQICTAVFDGRTAVVPKLLLHLEQLRLDDFHPALYPIQNVLQIRNHSHQLIVLRAQLVSFKPCQFLKTHVQDGPGLNLGEVKLVHQAVSRFFWSLARTNQSDDRINVVKCNDQSLKDVGAFLRFAQIVLGTANNHLVAMLHIVRHHLLQVKKLWSPFYQCNVVD